MVDHWLRYSQGRLPEHRGEPEMRNGDEEAVSVDHADLSTREARDTWQLGMRLQAALAGPTPDEIMARFTSLSSRSLRRIADRAEAIITERVDDGVFD